MWDKTAADIQEDIVIDNDDVVKGISKYVPDWSSAGFDPSKGTNFVALHFKCTEGSMTAECVPSQGSPTPSFTDDDAVLQITPETTGIKIKHTVDGVTNVGVYALNVELKEE